MVELHEMGTQRIKVRKYLQRIKNRQLIQAKISRPLSTRKISQKWNGCMLDAAK